MAGSTISPVPPTMDSWERHQVCDDGGLLTGWTGLNSEMAVAISQDDPHKFRTLEMAAYMRNGEPKPHLGAVTVSTLVGDVEMPLPPPNGAELREAYQLAGACGESPMHFNDILKLSPSVDALRDLRDVLHPHDVASFFVALLSSGDQDLLVLAAEGLPLRALPGG